MFSIGAEMENNQRKIRQLKGNRKVNVVHSQQV
jgi:hypothetical protein